MTACVYICRVNLPTAISQVMDLTGGQMGGRSVLLLLSCIDAFHFFSCYTGQLIDGLRNGWGCFKCANSNVVYTGEWKNTKRHGKVDMITLAVCYIRVYIHNECVG